MRSRKRNLRNLPRRKEPPELYTYQNEPTWSTSEKAIARKIFDAALGRELQDIMQKTKQMMNQIKDPRDVWELERYLTECRKEIDCKYDYRHPQLTRVCGTLLCEPGVTKAIRFLCQSPPEDAA